MRNVLIAMLALGLFSGLSPGMVDRVQAQEAAETMKAPIAVASIPDDLRLDPEAVPGGARTLLCLALNDYWEARGETLAGRLAVAKVVLNRVGDERYPSDVCAVVTENRTDRLNACQFSWHCDGRSDTPAEQLAWRRSLLLAAAVLYAGDSIQDPTAGALWYHATSVTPAWSEHLEVVRQIGHHIFYRDTTVPAAETPRQLASASLP